MNALETGQDAQLVRDKLGLTQAELADAIGVSVRQLRRHETENVLDTTVALAIECLLRRRAASHQMAVSPEERAERKFREQQRLRELRQAAGHVVGMTPGDIAARQLAIAAEKRRLQAEQGYDSFEARAKRQLDMRAARKRLSLIRARNRARVQERPVIARLHAALKNLYGDSFHYRAALDSAQQGAAKSFFVDDYIGAARQALPPDDSPLITLPLEIEP